MKISVNVEVHNERQLLRELLIGIYRADRLVEEDGQVGTYDSCYHNDIEFNRSGNQKAARAAMVLFKELQP